MPYVLLCGKGSNIRWKHLMFDFVVYIVQLFKEDCTVMQIHSAVRPCSPE